MIEHVNFIHATEALHGDMGVINSNDIIIFYSNSGDTEEIVKLVPLLKVLKCKIISITGNKKYTASKIFRFSSRCLCYQRGLSK
uniref:SIS domain-containing protein n=1 Tax=uncultured organism MedDCM-OCT-S08-C1481 TaxID=743630 RepID=D6PKM8_9ZZZZ|nr:hypothetical protein [uncultured organism MedDCM-OCT-S08-C1481]